MSDETVLANAMSAQEFNEELFRVNALIRSAHDHDYDPRVIHLLRVERRTLCVLRDQTLRMRTFTQDGGVFG